MKKWFLVLVGACAMSGAALAQDSHPLVDAIAKHWQTSKAFTLAVIEKMPEDSFSFKATPAEMSFGEMASHIGDANQFYCSTALGGTRGSKGSDFSKSGAIKHLNETFDYCIDGIKKLSDADLTKAVGKAPRQSTVFEALWGGFTHTAHHRAALEVYLRLKGLEPPQYQF
jgi:uncharacterized damage-inducible protein DinB